MTKYLPFMSGVYTTAPGLTPQSRGTESFFDFEGDVSKYLENKNRCRQEDLSKYHCIHEYREGTRQVVESFLEKHITTSKPDYAKYASRFDALCSQLAEDVAVVQVDGDKDWLAAIHLCSPNHWDPRTKIGRPFNEIHQPVPGIERTVKNYEVMLKMIIEKPPFIRFAWGISTDDRLNHHPEPPNGIDSKDWNGRVSNAATDFYVRAERQTLIGLKEVNAFIFLIRTYFYNILELDEVERATLIKAVNSMTDESLKYKGMYEMKDRLLLALAK